MIVHPVKSCDVAPKKSSVDRMVSDTEKKFLSSFPTKVINPKDFETGKRTVEDNPFSNGDEITPGGMPEDLEKRFDNMISKDRMSEGHGASCHGGSCRKGGSCSSVKRSANGHNGMNEMLVMPNKSCGPSPSDESFPNARSLVGTKPEPPKKVVVSRVGHGANTGKVIRNLGGKDKTISDYLRTAKYKKVLVRCHHGLGDTLLMHAAGAIDKLRAEFPDIEIKWHVRLGQEEIFGEVSDDENDYDIVFDPKMPISEWDRESWNKAEKCIEVEYGLNIERGKCKWELPKAYPNTIIGFHFHSTCMKNLCANENSARKLWEYVESKGFCPLSTHMHHKNSHTTLFEFEKNNIASCKPTVPKLLGVLKGCAGFAGTASGNFHASLFMIPPRKILFLKTDFSVDRITYLPVHELDIRDPAKIDFSVVDEWLLDVVSDFV